MAELMKWLWVTVILLVLAGGVLAIGVCLWDSWAQPWGKRSRANRDRRVLP